jgi:hypothetical protein
MELTARRLNFWPGICPLLCKAGLGPVRSWRSLSLVGLRPGGIRVFNQHALQFPARVSIKKRPGAAPHALPRRAVFFRRQAETGNQLRDFFAQFLNEVEGSK